MKKFFLLCLSLFLLSTCAFSVDYDAIYENLEQPNFKLLKNIDPFQENDYYNYAWAPYPLFRSSSPLYYKGGVIEPGYYLLVARTMQGRDYIFFKENGTVKHVIPVYKKETVPENFYKNMTPEKAKTKGQKIKTSIQNKFFNTFKQSQKQTPPGAFIRTEVIDRKYNELVLYYAQDKYYVLFRLEKDW